MSTNWTKEQREAIDARGKNLLVSAAAGSGKTAVLVERIISLMIEERVEVGELLIVTFTNAAAGEMKERIQKKLQEKRRELLAGENNGGQKELIGFLTKQIQNIPQRFFFCFPTCDNILLLILKWLISITQIVRKMFSIITNFECGINRIIKNRLFCIHRKAFFHFFTIFTIHL